MSATRDSGQPPPVPEALRSPMSQQDMETGFRAARAITRVAALFMLLLAAGAVAKESKVIPVAVVWSLLTIAVYVTVVARLRAHFDRANAEISSRRPEDLAPGGFSDEDEGGERL